MLTHSNIITNQYNLPYIIIDNFKTIVSYSLKSSDSTELLLRNTPQVGESIVEIVPQDQVEYIFKLIDYCLAENTTTVADKNLVSKIVKSPSKVQILFVSLPINVFHNCVVCLFMPISNFANQKIVHQQQDMEFSNLLEQQLFTERISDHATLKTKIDNLSSNINSQIEMLTKIADQLNRITHQEDQTFISSKLYKKTISNHLFNDNTNQPKVVRKCSYCESDAVERIPRNGFMKTVFFWIPIQRYICYNCLHKFHIIKKQGTPPHHHSKHIH